MRHFLISYRTPTGRTRRFMTDAPTTDQARDNCVNATGCDFTSIVRITEAVTTADLKEGDLIECNGCVMQLGPISERFDTVNRGAFGQVRWTTARVIEQLDGTIPQSWFGTDETGVRTWQVQGNDRATWHRIDPTAPTLEDFVAACEAMAPQKPD